jgi:hypothetical protein
LDQANRYVEQIIAAIGNHGAYNQVHILYAGPMSIPFLLGAALLESVHLGVVLYEYAKGSYSWGVRINGSASGRWLMISKSR